MWQSCHTACTVARSVCDTPELISVTPDVERLQLSLWTGYYVVLYSYASMHCIAVLS